MRDFIDLVKNGLREGEVVDLSQHKKEKAFAGFADAVRGLYQGEKDFFSTGKFAPFAETFIKSGFDRKFAPKILLDVKFRDYRKSPEARALCDELRAQRFKIMAGEKWGKGYRPKENTNQDMMGGWAEKEISMQEARAVFADRENSQFGAYQPSRSGFRTTHLNVWDERGVGFSILAGGHESRRGDKYGNPYTEEYHIIDDDDDMKDLAQMFALIQRATMAGN